MGDFLNEYAAKLQVFFPVIVAVIILLPVFGYFYNRLMDKLKGKEHMSVYVAGGVLVTLGAGALISWKSSLLFLVLFGLDGIFMMVGEYKRTEKQAKTRIKRLPYKANAMIDAAKMSATSMHQLMGRELQSHDPILLNRIQHELTTVLVSLEELKNIQRDQ
jgi:predicted membrane channel-forming protein YqfA (hemolysin III family)